LDWHWESWFGLDEGLHRQRAANLLPIDSNEEQVWFFVLRRIGEPPRVNEVLEQVIAERAAQIHLRSDNGLEFVSLIVLGRPTRMSAQTAFIAPCKPWKSITNESFNGKFGD